MRRLLALSAIALLAALAFACDPHEPARATIMNQLPAEGAASFTVDKTWFRTTLFFRPVKPGESTEAATVGFGRESAYFVLSLGDPAKRIFAISTREVEIAAGEQGSISVNPQSIRSACVGEKLGKDEWNFMRERIFPNEDVLDFDAPCPTPAPVRDGGADAAHD